MTRALTNSKPRGLLAFEFDRFHRNHGFVMVRIGVLFLPFALALSRAWAGLHAETTPVALPLWGTTCAVAWGLSLLVIVTIVLPNYTGFLFVRERHERVLPLLALTSYSPFAWILLKAIPPFLTALTLLAALTPVGLFAMFALSIPWDGAIVLFVYAFPALVLACAAGTWVTSKTNEAGTLVGQGFIIVLTTAALVPLLLFSLGFGLAAAIPGASSQGFAVWASLGLSALFVLLFSGGMLDAAAATFFREDHWNPPTPSVASARARRQSTSQRQGDPVTRIARALSGNFDFSARRGAWNGVAFAGLAIVANVPVIGPVLVAAMLQRDATISIRRNREDGRFDDLALLPYTDRELARAFLLGQVPGCWPYVAAAITGWCVQYGVIVYNNGPQSPAYHAANLVVLLAYCVGALTLATLDGVAPRPSLRRRVCLYFGLYIYAVPTAFVCALAFIPGLTEFLVQSLSIHRILGDWDGAMTIMLLVTASPWAAVALVLVIALAVPTIGQSIRNAEPNPRPRTNAPRSPRSKAVKVPFHG